MALVLGNRLLHPIEELLVPIDEGDLFDEVGVFHALVGGLEMVQDRIGVDEVVERAFGLVTGVFGVKVVEIRAVRKFCQTFDPVEFGKRDTMNVLDRLEEVILGVDPFGFVAALEQGTGATVATIEVHGISSANPAHEIFDIVFALLPEEKVVGCGGEAISNKTDLVLEKAGVGEAGPGHGPGFGGLLEGREVVSDRGVEVVVVNVVFEDVTIVDTAVKEVVVGIVLELGFTDWHIDSG